MNERPIVSLHSRRETTLASLAGQSLPDSMACSLRDTRQQKAFKLAFAVIAPAVLCLTAVLGIVTYKLRASHRDAYGRSFVDHNSPRCCFTVDCLGAAREGFLARTGSIRASMLL